MFHTGSVNIRKKKQSNPQSNMYRSIKFSCFIGKKNKNYQSCRQGTYLQNHTLGSTGVLF
jgi:hypothetical protein